MHGVPVQAAGVAVPPLGMHATDDNVASRGCLAIIEAHEIHSMVLRQGHQWSPEAALFDVQGHNGPAGDAASACAMTISIDLMR
jgi:hypothetical protein